MFHRRALRTIRAPYVAAGAAYQGPGDVVSGALAWWGLRAYTAAAATGGALAVKLIDSSLTHTADIALVSTGGLDLSNAFFGTYSPPYYVEELYDQTGSGDHLFGATRRPGFVTTGNGLTVPNMSFVKASLLYLDLASPSFTHGLPMSLSLVFNRTYSGNSDIMFSVGTLVITAHTVANFVYMYNGGGGSNNATGVADGSWHGAQAGFNNGTSDFLDVDNTTVSGTPAGSAAPSSSNISIGGFSDFMGGFVAEAGIWGAQFTAPQTAAMYANQHSYYGVF